MGVEALLDTYNELCGPSCVLPIEITELQLFTDSHVSLDWINNYSNKFTKSNKLKVFVKNRLFRIAKLCEDHPVIFKFCAGSRNPSDVTTRPVSSRQLLASNFYTGIDIELILNAAPDATVVTVPAPQLTQQVLISTSNSEGNSETKLQTLIDPGRYSSFSKLVKVHQKITQFIRNCKIKVAERNPSKYGLLYNSNEDSYQKAVNTIIIADQANHFADVLNYFSCNENRKRKIPAIITQLNVIRDEDGILRVKGKFKT